MRHYQKYRTLKAMRRHTEQLIRQADAGGVDLSSNGPDSAQDFAPMSDTFDLLPAEQVSNSNGSNKEAPMMRHEGAAKPPYQFFWNGLSVIIENPAGSIRQGTDKDGTHWQIEMKDHYGFVKNTRGADGEGIDVFINPAAPEHFDNTSGNIYVVHQEVDGKYDEDKVMIGYQSQTQAERAYNRNYAKGWEGLDGGVTELTDVDFLNKYVKEHWHPKTKYKKSAQINSLNDLSNNVGESGAPMKSMGPHSEQDDAHMLEDNTSEDVDLHMQGMMDLDAQVEAPSSDGTGPEGVNFEEEDDQRKVVNAHSVSKVGFGSDPYKLGRVYQYQDLMPQHQHEIDINKGLGSKRRGLLWLRTAMPLWQIIDESEYWYRKNFNHKWRQADRNKAISLAELFHDGATITPLMVSPPGEDNGGLWEGYHRLRAAEMLMLPSLPVVMKIDPSDSVWQLRVAEFPREPWVCVDFDGTIANTEHHMDGHEEAKPMDGVIECLQRMIDAGWRVSVWSARQSTMGEGWKEELEAWLDHHDVPYSDIYEGKKPPADAFIDNSGIQYDGDWDDVFVRTENLINEHRGAGLLGVGDNMADAYTNGDETRDDLAVTRAPSTEGLMTQTASVSGRNKK